MLRCIFVIQVIWHHVRFPHIYIYKYEHVYVSTRFCTLNIICMAFYECDYQLIPDTQHTLYICVCARVCVRCSSNSLASPKPAFHRIRFGHLFHLLYRTFVHTQTYTHAYVCVWMNASCQFIHDVLRVNRMNFVLRVFVLFYFFHSPYFIWFYYQFNMKVSFSLRESESNATLMHTSTWATGNAHRKERENAKEKKSWKGTLTVTPRVSLIFFTLSIGA